MAAPVPVVASLLPPLARGTVVTIVAASVVSVGPAERTDDRWKFGSCRLRLTLKLLLRDI